jgi:probable HAF family extracellular repeat protein
MKSSISTRFAASTLLAVITTPTELSAQEHLQTPQHHHYKLIDMGTFGGPLSGINEPVNYVPALNSRGQATGFSANLEPQTVLNNPAACFGGGSIINVTHAFERNHEAVTDLGSLAGPAFCSDANSINERGEIQGLSEIDVVDPVLGFYEMRAVVWKHGQLINLGTLGGDNSWAFGINNSGQVVGLAQNAVPDPYSILDFVIFGGFSAGTQTRAFLWQDGVMRDVGTLGGPDAWAGGINEHGQVAGQSYVNSTPNPATGFPTLDPFFWDKGKMRDLGSLGGVVGFVEEMNNRGQIIGGSSTAENPNACIAPNLSIEFSNPGCDPYLWDGKEMIDLSTHTAGGTPFSGDAISDSGEIVGAATFPNQPYDAYLRRQDGRAIDLGHVTGDCFSEAWAINIHSQVVGDSFSCGSTFQHAAFLWEAGSFADLNSLIAGGSSLQLVFANAINDRGEIAGNGVPPGASPGDVFTLGHAFLLIPCDEGHPDIEDCDYSLVDAGSTAQRSVSKNESHQVPAIFRQTLAGRFRTRRR